MDNVFDLCPKRQTVTESPDQAHQSDIEQSKIFHDGNLAYTYVEAGNGSKPSYQEAIGAPVESKSPLGYHVGWLTVIFLNVNQMVGTGIFSTRKDSKTCSTSKLSD